jgi:hypothetical protein
MLPHLWQKLTQRGAFLRRLLCVVFVAGGSALISGCDEAPVVETHLGERALAYAESLIATYPQREAGVHSEAVASWLVAQLGEGADKQVFQTPHGTMVNVVKAHPHAVAILASHYDTKVGIPNFVGANDGASTTGLLLALAMETDWPVTYLFLDGEECREAYSAKDGLHGSWHYAKRVPTSDRLPVIVLDMLGDKDLQLSLAANGSSQLNRLIRRAAKQARIPLGDAGEIVDDHLPFVIEGWQAADIIDFDYGPEHCWWHTADDTMDKLSATSLAQTATLVREVIDCLMKEKRK